MVEGLQCMLAMLYGGGHDGEARPARLEMLFAQALVKR